MRLARAAILLAAAFSAALLSGSFAGRAPSEAEAVGPVGVFAGVGVPNRPVPDEIVSLPVLSGFVVRTRWADVQPLPGTYDWRYIDAELARARRAGKLIILRVTAGSNSPDWIYARRVPRVPVPPGVGRPPYTPVPWDARYMTLWNQFVAQLGARYGGDPNIYFTSMAGPTFFFNEMILPSYIDWVALGYTEERLVKAWKQTLGAYAASFGATPFSIALNPVLGSTLPAEQVVAYGLRQLRSRLFVQGNWLSPTRPGPGETASWQLYNLIVNIGPWATTGFQIARNNLGERTYEGEMATDAGKTIERAQRSGASYVEVPNALLLDPAVLADVELLAPRFVK
jgi:hypothetical protein